MQEITPRAKMIWPLGVSWPSSFTHNVMPENRTSDATFSEMPSTGRGWGEAEAVCKTGRERLGSGREV